MKTIFQVWQDSGRLPGLKVRWKDWDYHYSYFIIEGLNDGGNSFYGRLCTGEKISYPVDSLNWDLYHVGDEEDAKAV